MGYSEPEILNALEGLRSSGRVSLRPRSFDTFPDFFKTVHWNTGFWTVAGLSGVYVVMYALPIVFPWSLLRIPVGLSLLFYFPGHNLLKVLLRGYRSRASERYILELAVSIFIILIVGLLLSFTLLGLSSAPDIGAVIGLNLVLGALGAYVDYRNLSGKNRS